MALLIIFLILFLFYTVLILYYWKAWNSCPVYTPKKILPTTKISVIIPARNEEENIERLLETIENQTYPPELFETILVDDHSTDGTVEKVWKFSRVKLVSLNEDGINSYKKMAIEKGIEASGNELIVCTDADCIVQPRWLETISTFHEEKKAALIAAPVTLDCNSSILQLFQCMDFMVLQGITAASVHKNFHSMANGANLAYLKNIFFEVEGFKGIDHIASGDDMLLMGKIRKKYPGKLFYLKSKEAIVSSLPQKSWKEFFEQRKRWASKASSYQEPGLKAILVLVYLFNLSFLFLLVAGIWNSYYWTWLLGGWILKTLVELPFLNSVSRFFNKQWMVKYLFLFQPMHIAYTIVAGWMGLFGKYNWKGRQVR